MPFALSLILGLDFNALLLWHTQLVDVISSKCMSVLELYHATAHMQAKLVALSLKRGTRLVRLTSADSRKKCLRLLGCQPGCTIVSQNMRAFGETGSKVIRAKKPPK